MFEFLHGLAAYLISFRRNRKSQIVGIRAPRSARNPNEKGEPFGAEAADFATRKYMQRDVEVEFDSVDKSGGFIGALYLNKTENVAVSVVREGFATVHSFSADNLSWAKHLYDAEVCLNLRSCIIKSHA